MILNYIIFKNVNAINILLFYYMKGLPEDVLIDYIYKDDNYVLVKDVKHTDKIFHYTIWSLDENMKDINNLNTINIFYLDEFIQKIKNNNYFNNEKMYFTYPPTHSRLHLHILPIDYVSYRPLCELFNYQQIRNLLS